MSYDDPQPGFASGSADFDWPVFGLIDDVRPALSAARDRGEAVALATLHAAIGGAPRGVGAQMVFGPEGARAGFLSGGCVEADVALHAAATLADGQARRLTYGDNGPLDIVLPCGSRIDILVERISAHDEAVGAMLQFGRERLPAFWSSDGAVRACTASPTPPPSPMLVTQRFDPPVRVLIVGADPVALATATLAAQMGYAVELIRPMGPAAPPPLDLSAYTRSEAGESLERAAPDPWTAVCILTHDLAVEHAAVSAALRTPGAYIGVLGSRRRAPEREAWLRASGFTQADIARLHAPIGLPIAGKAPWEIAVSVLAEVVQTLHARPSAAEPAGKTTLVDTAQ